MVGRPESLAARFHFEFEGEEHLYAAVKEGKGAVLVTSHCGNWEAAAHLLQRIQVPVNVVAYRGEAAGMREFFERASKGRHFSLLVADGSPDVTLAILAALSRGEVVAMHADRALTAQGERIPFLGAPAWFPTGPYLVAAASGAPLVHTFAMREGTYRYHFYAYPPEHLSLPAQPGAAQDRELLRDCAARFVGRLEEKVRQYPLQWHNFYDFWEVGRLRDERRRTKGG
jgi:predicted LPLAT superfamily acyltransferase